MSVSIVPAIKIPEPIQRFEDGVKVISGDPYMEETDEPQRYVWVEQGYHWYYNTETEDIQMRKD
jgi:hypothetical protein